MLGSMRQFILKKLKENVPLAEIKEDLKEKGYDIEIINKAVREAISGIDKKLPSTTILQIGILIVGIAIAITIAVYLTTKEISISPKLPADFQETIRQFLKDNLNKELLPDSLAFNKATGRNNTHIANWTADSRMLTVAYTGDQKIEFLTVSVPSQLINTTLAPNIASSIAKLYFQDLEENWKCTTAGSYSFCETFLIENDGNKRSVFVITPFGKLLPQTLVVSCLIPPGSEFYERDSCVMQ